MSQTAQRKAGWAGLPEGEPASEPRAPEAELVAATPPRNSRAPHRGSLAVLHSDASRRGRRSAHYPDLHIVRTAEKLGVTQVHLQKILSGASRPSLDLAIRLADALGLDVKQVAGLYQQKNRQKGRHGKS